MRAVRSSHFLRVALASLGLALALQPSPLQAQKAPDAVPADVLTAQAWLTSIYPDLDLKGLATSFRVDQGRVLISVAPAPATSKRATEVVPLVRAAVELDASGRLLSFAADGVYLEQTRNLAFAEALKANPKWVDSDAEVWLMQAGGRPVTGRAFAAPVNFDAAAIKSALGGRGVGQEAQFHWRSPGKSGQAAKFAGRPAWIVSLVVPGDKGPALHYELEFEPFSERLVRVTRQ